MLMLTPAASGRRAAWHSRAAAVRADSGGVWQAVSGAEYDAVGRSVCAAGVTEFGALAAAYVLP